MAKYLKTADSEWYKQRIMGIILCVLAAFTVLFIRLFILQVIKGEEFSRLSENNSIRLQNIDPPRGMIFDRNGIMVVDNRPSFEIGIIPKDARPVEATLDKLTDYIDIPMDQLRHKISKARGIRLYQPVALKRDIGRNALAVVEAHKYDLPGVIVNMNPRRRYLYHGSAAHLLGYLGEINSGELKSERYPNYRQGDFIGRFGIEKTYEPILRGQRGGRQVEVNATGQVVNVLRTVNASPGNNIKLAIDHRVQQKAEDLLNGVVGAVVALDPTSGQVLALASSPSFDQNAFWRGMTHEHWALLTSDPLKPLANRAIQGVYPPASTYKILTAIAGLEEGVIDVGSTYTCPGYYRFAGREYRCWRKHGHGRVNVVRAIAESCDVFFYQVGQAVGVDRLAWFAKVCGLGAPTGINLDHEEAGLIPTAAWKKRRTGIEWQEGETLSLSIGEGFNLVTPLQMAALISAVANGGTLYRPEIVLKVESAAGETIAVNTPETIRNLPISEKTLELVRKGLWEVVNTEGGTARGARFAGLDISGKTGTAQVVSRKEEETDEEELPDHLKPHAWFVAYAPSTEADIAVAVVVEHGEHGSGAAAPIARELIKSYLLRKETNTVVERDRSDSKWLAETE